MACELPGPQALPVSWLREQSERQNIDRDSNRDYNVPCSERTIEIA